MSDLLSDKVLGSKTLKALASSKRTTIIKNLSSRRMTVTELSKISGLSKSTIYDNLSVLVQSFQNKRAMKTICYKVFNYYVILESLY